MRPSRLDLFSIFSSFVSLGGFDLSLVSSPSMLLCFFPRLFSSSSSSSFLLLLLLLLPIFHLRSSSLSDEMLLANRFFNLTIYSSCMRCLKILSARVKYSLLSRDLAPLLLVYQLKLFSNSSRGTYPNFVCIRIRPFNFWKQRLAVCSLYFLICEPNQSNRRTYLTPQT